SSRSCARTRRWLRRSSAPPSPAPPPAPAIAPARAPCSTPSSPTPRSSLPPSSATSHQSSGDTFNDHHRFRHGCLRRHPDAVRQSGPLPRRLGDLLLGRGLLFLTRAA